MLLPCTRLSSLRGSSQLLLLYTRSVLFCRSRSWPPLCGACVAAHMWLECKLLELKALPMRSWKCALQDTVLSLMHAVAWQVCRQQGCSGTDAAPQGR